MPATLDKLPDELLTLILNYVDSADQSWRDLKLEKGKVATSAGQQAGRDDVAKGRWSSTYGHGVFALSYVDKRWNALARPLLFKSLNLTHVGSDFFGLHVLGEPLGRHVQQLRLDFDIVPKGGVPYLAVAAALRKLPNVTSFVLSTTMLSRIKHEARSSPTAQELETRLWTALRGAFAVQIQPYTVHDLVEIIGRVNPARLRSLTVDFVRYSDSDSSEREATEALQLLTGLRSLSIVNVKASHVLAWSSSMVLPRLRALSVRAGWPLEQSLRWAAALAPNVASMAVRAIGFSGIAPLPSPLDLPPLSFPHLRILAFGGIATFPTGLLFIPLCKLEALHVRLAKRDSNSIAVPSPLPIRFPIALRELVVEAPAGETFTDLAALETACGRHDVAFVSRQYFTPAPRRVAAGPSAPVVVAPPKPGQAAQVQDTLGWAMERTRWLAELEDGPGLQEMAEAAERLRERRAIERS